MTEPQKDCFGLLEKVFPLGDQGLREVPPQCFDCPDRKACMQAALGTHDGMAFRDELLERSPEDGILGRIKRWSEKKSLARQMKEDEKSKK